MFLFQIAFFNSLWPSDAKWGHISELDSNYHLQCCCSLKKSFHECYWHKWSIQWACRHITMTAYIFLDLIMICILSSPRFPGEISQEPTNDHSHTAFRVSINSSWPSKACIDGLVQDCSNSSALAMALLQITHYYSQMLGISVHIIHLRQYIILGRMKIRNRTEKPHMRKL